MRLLSYQDSCGFSSPLAITFLLPSPSFSFLRTGNGVGVFDRVRSFFNAYSRRLECSLFIPRPEESMTDQMLTGIEIESRRQLRREAQRSRRGRETSTDRDLRRKTNAGAMRAARNATQGPLHDPDSPEHWWVRMARLNSSETKPVLGLHWNKTCKHCGIQVRIRILIITRSSSHSSNGLS